ncbi:MAG: GntR family transcriptional regulator [Bacillota bacterium]|jgi:GntR family transcriptional regulator
MSVGIKSKSLYRQLAERLEKEIESGKWMPGDRLPSENDMVKQFGLGRASVKRAISELSQKNLVYSIQGKGTFVAEPQIRTKLLSLTSFTEDMLSRGLKPQSRLVELQIITAGSDLAEKLNISSEEKVIKLSRLRLVNEEPIILETSYLPYKDCHGILDENLSNESLYKILRDKCGIILRTAKDTLEPVFVGDKEAVLLEVPPKSLAILIDRISYTTDGRPMEYSTGMIRGDKCRFYFDLVNNLYR